MTLYGTLLLIAVGVLGVPAVVASVYLLLATLLSGQMPSPRFSKRTLRFDVIVPAHNEAEVIARTVTSLRQLNWPAELFRITVVADNCSDATAEIAAQAGALVVERQNLLERGKGRALSFAFDLRLREPWCDAVAVVDADSVVSSNLLEAFAARVEAGADAVQAHYGVLNPNASWRTRLITIAKGAFHIVRSRARERLKLSCGIRGNGWCITRRLLERMPYNAFSLTEDVEYGIDLGLAGYRVHYVDEASADGEMVSSGASASKQRQRWEYGRFQLIRQRTLPLLYAAARNRSAVCLDLALDLMVLPLSYLVLNIGIFFLVSVLAFLVMPAFRNAIWISAACAAVVVLYVLRGWRLSGIGWRGLLDLLWAPVFLVWKVLSMVNRRGPKEWVRTDRENP
jgi:cellulose synthase/poly-beta-1,6-N-acetylglucosamine synthase-like glycosyltransferase